MAAEKVQPKPPVLDLPGNVEPMPVRVAGVDYDIHELDGPGLSLWMKFTSSKQKRDAAGDVIEQADFNDWQETLIFLTLKKKNGEPVDLTTIKSWGSKTKNALFIQAREQSGLDTTAKKG